LAGVVFAGLTSTDQTTTRYQQSHDAQQTSAFLANDVQSTKQITAQQCGPIAGATNLLNLSYDGARQGASYYFLTAANGQHQLVRVYCPASGTPQATVVLARFVGSASPTVTCDGTTCNPSTTPRPSQVAID